MKTNTIISFALIAALVFSCSPELEVFTSFPNGKKLRSIKVVYHDEYGDMDHLDGEYYSWVEFDRRGRITEIKRGTLRENPSHEEMEMLTRSYHRYSIDNMVWYLDYGFYKDVSLIAFGANEWARRKAKMQEVFPDKSIVIARDADGNPTTISVNSDNEEVSYKIDELFQYDDKQRLVSWSSTRHFVDPSGEAKSFMNKQDFIYNDFGQLISITDGGTETKILYDDQANIKEILIGDANSLRIRHEYFYNELGLRTKSVTYSADNQKEFSQEYVYRFF